MFRFMIFSVFLATAIAGNIGSQCLGNGQLPISFEIEGCSSTPCALPQLEDAVFKAKFVAPRNSKTLRANLVAYLFSILNIPFDLGADADACTGLNTSCPIQEGQELDYTLKLPIQTFFPIGTSMNTEVSVQDDTGSPVFCARVPIVITPPRN